MGTTRCAPARSMARHHRRGREDDVRASDEHARPSAIRRPVVSSSRLLAPINAPSMTSHRFAWAAALFALLARTDAAPAQSGPAATLAIEHVTVLPMTRDTALADHTVLAWRDRVVWVGPSSDAKVPRGAQRVDGRGAYVIPGLADMHVHLATAQDLSDLVAAGVTTVRNMRGSPQHLAWRDSVAAGTLVGPTIFTSGPSIRRGRLLGRADPRFVFPKTTAEAEQPVRQQTAIGYDMIKVL